MLTNWPRMIIYLGVLGGFLASCTRGVEEEDQLPKGGTPSAYILTDLGTLGGVNSTARAINNAGQVVGISSEKEDISFSGFIWSCGVMKRLPGPRSLARSLNSLGEVVGTIAVLPSPAIGGYAVIWRTDKIINLGTLANRETEDKWSGTHSSATDINDAVRVHGVPKAASPAVGVRDASREVSVAS